MILMIVLIVLLIILLYNIISYRHNNSNIVITPGTILYKDNNSGWSDSKDERSYIYILDVNSKNHNFIKYSTDLNLSGYYYIGQLNILYNIGYKVLEDNFISNYFEILKSKNIFI